MIYGRTNRFKFYSEQSSLVLVTKSHNEQKEWIDALRIFVAPLKLIQDIAIFIAHRSNEFKIRLDFQTEDKFRASLTYKTKSLVDQPVAEKLGNFNSIMGLSKDTLEQVLEETEGAEGLVRFCLVVGAACRVISAGVRLAYRYTGCTV